MKAQQESSIISVPLPLNCWSPTVYSVEFSAYFFYCFTLSGVGILNRPVLAYGSACVKEIESTPWETEVFISTSVFKMLNFLFLSVIKVIFRERLWFVTFFPSRREIVLERLKHKFQWL